MFDVGQDLRHGLRIARARPAVALVIVLTLALGIGANTAIFSLTYAVLFKALPYPQPDRLVRVWLGEETEAGGLIGFELDKWRLEARSFDALAGYRTVSITRSDRQEAEQIEAARVSAALFSVLQVAPALGRVFRADEERTPVAILSDSLWRSRFGSEPSVLGTTAILDGAAHTIVGVMPSGFAFPEATTALWVPLGSTGVSENRNGAVLVAMASALAVGRLKDSASAQQAEAEGATIFAGALRSRARVRALHDATVGHIRVPLALLQTVAGLVLMMACANVANILLAQGTARQHEMAVRAALGAGTGRLVRQLLSESLLFGLLGGAVGLGVGAAGITALKHWSPPSVPYREQISLDGASLIVGLAASMLCGLLAGLAPALRGMRIARANQTTGNRDVLLRGLAKPPSRAGRAMITFEVAMALALLVCTNLVGRSFLNLVSAYPGYDAKDVVAAQIRLPAVKYSSLSTRAAFYQELLQRLSSIPSTESAGLTSELPPGGHGAFNFQVLGAADGGVEDRRIISPEYLRVIRVPLIRGRDFTEQDTDRSAPVVVVNRAFAKKYFHGRDAIGQRLIRSGHEWEIVGVVGDTTEGRMAGETWPMVYFSYLQARYEGPLAEESAIRRMSLAVRTTHNASAVLTEIRARSRSLDPTLSIDNGMPLEQWVFRSAAGTTFYAGAMAVFGVIALLLSAVGVFGLVAYSVARRTRDIGLCLAIGAQKSDVFLSVLKEGLLVGCYGAAIGLPVSFVLTRGLGTFLYGVTATDPAALLSMPSLLIAVCLLASVVPAWRASRLQPGEALRVE